MRRRRLRRAAPLLRPAIRLHCTMCFPEWMVGVGRDFKLVLQSTQTINRYTKAFSGARLEKNVQSLHVGSTAYGTKFFSMDTKFTVHDVIAPCPDGISANFVSILEGAIPVTVNPRQKPIFSKIRRFVCPRVRSDSKSSGKTRRIAKL